MIDRAPTRHANYQLLVAAVDVGDLILSAGGWMCDRIQAGWDVSVTITEPRDMRALQILGVTALVTDDGLEAMENGRGTAAVAFAPAIFETNQTIRSAVLNALDHGCAEVIVWGPTIPSELHSRVERQPYRLSGAARAFKAHALAAASIPTGDVAPTEELFGAWPR